MWRSIFIGWLIGAGFLMNLNGQAFQIRSLGLEEGLSQSSVSAIVQDSLGYVWMATQDGLNRFDGYEFTVFKKEPFDSATLSANRISTLMVDDRGLLWVGTAFHGLNILNPGTGKIRRIVSDPHDLTSLSNNMVNCLKQDSQGNIWVGTANGLNQLVLRGTNPMTDSISFIRYHHSPDATRKGGSRFYARQILERSNGEIWVAGTGSDGGIRAFEYMQNGVPVPVGLPRELIIADLSIYSMEEDALGRIWMGTYGGIQIWNSKTQDWEMEEEIPEIKQEEVSRLVRAEDGNMWIGTNRGLHQLPYDRDAGKYLDKTIWFNADTDHEQSINGNMILSIYPDRINPEGIWVGTYTGGANYISRNHQPFTTNRLRDANLPGLSSRSLTAILKDKHGIIWLGTYEGLVRYDPVRNAYKLFQENDSQWGLKRNYVMCLFEDSGGRIWIGAYDGFCEVVSNPENGNTRFVYHESPCSRSGAFCITEEQEGVLAIGGYTGIDLFDSDKKEFIQCGKPLDEVYSGIMDYRIRDLFQDSRSRLWVGTSAGLILLEGEGKMKDLLQTAKPRIFYHLPEDSTSLRSHVISGIVEDDQGGIWLGTMDGLIQVLEEDGEFRFVPYTERAGLANNMIYSIVANKSGNEIWMSSNGGLTRMRQGPLRFDNFRIQDGLQSNEFNDRVFHCAQDGELLFGGIDGYSRFRIADIQADTLPPPIRLSRYVDGNGTEHDLAYEAPILLDIPWGGNSFSLGFIGVEYAHTDKLQYAYQMEGLSDAWVNCGSSRTAYFNALSPGTYQFSVKAMNGDGYWSDQAAQLMIQVYPPFWRTAWFFLLMGMAFLGLLWLAHYYRVQVNIKRVMELERVRKSTAADFHDELGHKLTIISLFGEIVKKQLNGSAETVGPHLDKMIATSNSLYYSMKDLLWVLDPEKDSVLDMILLLKDFGDELFDRTGVAFRADGIAEELSEPLLPMNYKRHIVLIFKEVMNNALKHANCRNAELRVDYRPDSLYIEFKDDGRGFDLKEARSGHGINNLYDRAEKIGSQLDVVSDPQGTCVSLRCEGIWVKGGLSRKT